MQDYKINVYNKGTIKYHYGSGLQIQECNILTGDIVNKAYIFSEETIEPDNFFVLLNSLPSVFTNKSITTDTFMNTVSRICEIYTKKELMFTNSNDKDVNEKIFSTYHLSKTGCYTEDEKYKFKVTIIPIDYIRITNEELGYVGYIICVPFEKDMLSEDLLNHIIEEKYGGLNISIVDSNKDSELRMITMQKNNDITNLEIVIDCFERIDSHKWVEFKDKSVNVYQTILTIKKNMFTIITEEPVKSYDKLQEDVLSFTGENHMIPDNYFEEGLKRRLKTEGYKPIIVHVE